MSRCKQSLLILRKRWRAGRQPVGRYLSLANMSSGYCILGRPGSAIDLSFGPGYFIGLLGANMILAGGLIRQAQGARARKPPGVM